MPLPDPNDIPAAPHRLAGRFRLLGPVARTLRWWMWAAVAGALAAAATVVFRALVQGVEHLATGHAGGLVEAARSLSPWHRVVVCTAGGVLAGLVLEWGGRWAAAGPRGDAHLDYIDAARAGRVDLNDRTTLVRSASALLSVGSGASIGREGPMVQMAAWLAAWLARVVPIAPEQRSALMVCGIAAGIGSAYHAPVAGVVFVLELALGFFARHAVAPVLIAAGTASALIQLLVDPKPLYDVPAVAVEPTSLGLALVAAVLFGAVGWTLLHLLEGSRRAFGRVRSLPARLGLGGLLVGGLSACVPEVWGNGYSVVSSVLQGGHLWQWIVVVMLTKIVATALSSGSGAIGGVFTPSLFVGATAGSVLAQLAALALPAAWVGDPRALAIIGMAAVLAAVTHAPLMAIVMVLEMTNQFQMTVPVMLACAVAYAVSTQFGGRPLYGNPIEGQR
ncbi:chloride channel protein [Paracidovorax avenae]|uniref:chloride channel protein n=1 Tax=Paracidovorax avenae TaxID=80867 RepID=UPI001CEF609C|nr:chloride channel protein [Paracidovorax avenae]